jgi:mannose-6-phosphate isomerase
MAFQTTKENMSAVNGFQVDSSEVETKELIAHVESYIREYTIESYEIRPWGAFFIIAEQDCHKFMLNYFKERVDGCLISPKILLIKPNCRLSWQYHHRRKEIWSILEGPVGVVKSANDTETEIIITDKESIVYIDKEERHRLVGLDSHAIIAELWCHTDANNPSDETDIVRIQDDYKRYNNQ